MLLLDTCTLLWMINDPAALSGHARHLLEHETEGLLLSAISAYEIALKHRKQRLNLPCEPREWIKEAIAYHDITQVGVDLEIALAANELPPLHEDPFDRIIVATALANAVPVVTPDKLIAAYSKVIVQW